MAEAPERRYPIRADVGYFSVGRTADGRQVLVGLSCPNIVALYFDDEGTFLEEEGRPVPFFQDAVPPFDISDVRIPPMIAAWKAEMGFYPHDIRVKKFFSDKCFIGIEDYPGHFDEVLSDPAADDEEKDEIRGSMRAWDEGGQFVLWWGNDYWLDRSGRVVSS